MLGRRRIKINSDGAVKEDGTAGAGGVSRDELGRWVTDFVHNLGSCAVLKAELWGVLQGLKLAWVLGFRKVLVETDSLLVKNLIGKKLKLCHPLFSLVVQCQGSICRDWIVQFRHIYREANHVADFLASFALSFPLGFHVLESPPVGSSSLLFDDARGVSTPRFVAL